MYMAPEQVLGQPVPASDIYALGCIAYELLVGEPVFGGSLSASDYQLRHRHVEPVPLLRRRPDVPAELAALIMSCLLIGGCRWPSSTTSSCTGAPVPVSCLSPCAARSTARSRAFPWVSAT